MGSEDYIRLPGAWDIRHWIRIPALRQGPDGKTIEVELAKLDGVRSIEVYAARCRIQLKYDQSKFDFKSINCRLEGIGYPIADTWW